MVCKISSCIRSIPPCSPVVLILSAALDLVPLSTPKRIITFCNIALVAKVTLPYHIIEGKIRYTKWLRGCAVLSTTGMFFSAYYLRFGEHLNWKCV